MLGLVLSMARDQALGGICRAEAFYSAGMYALASGISVEDSREYLQEAISIGKETGDPGVCARPRVGIIRIQWMQGKGLGI